MKFLTALLVIIIASMSQLSFAQCETWVGSENMDHITDQHSVYRGFMTTENYADAFEPWKEVFAAAPAADGKRDFHYTDGIKMYKSMYDAETDTGKKEEYKKLIVELYDQCATCLLYTSPSPRDRTRSRMPSSA